MYDIVYMPMNTDFQKRQKKNAIIIFGYEMLLGQAVRAFEIWHGMEAPYNALKKALLGDFDEKAKATVHGAVSIVMQLQTRKGQQ